MEFEIRLFATLREGRAKKVMLELPADQRTPRHVIDILNIPLEEVAILLVNGRDGKFDQTLVLGDYLSIFPPVGGG